MNSENEEKEPKENTSNFYLKVYEHVIYSTKNITTALVLSKIISYSLQTGYCYASLETLADKLNISSRTVWRALNDLKKDGWIRDVGLRGKSKCYTVSNVRMNRSRKEYEEYISKIEFSPAPEYDDMDEDQKLEELAQEYDFVDGTMSLEETLNKIKAMEEEESDNKDIVENGNE